MGGWLILSCFTLLLSFLSFLLYHEPEQWWIIVPIIAIVFAMLQVINTMIRYGDCPHPSKILRKIHPDPKFWGEE